MYEQAATMLTALGREDTQTAGTLFNNWASALDGLGRPLEAEKIYRRAIDISRADQTEDAVSPILLVNYGRILRQLGQLDKASDYAERGYDKAQRAGDQIAIIQALLLRASVYKDQGQLDRAMAMLSDAEPRVRRNLPPGHIAFASLISQTSLILQARGELQAALDRADQAIATAEASIKAGQQGADYLPDLLLRRSDVNLQFGRIDDAVADASRAITLLQQSAEPGTYSRDFGHAYLTLGRALQAEGKSGEGRTAFHSAAEHLEIALGSGNPETLQAKQLAATGIRR